MAAEKEQADRERDNSLLMEKVPELFVVDIVSDLEMGDSDPTCSISAIVAIFLALLPPSLTSSRMSAPERSHLIFPHNMSASHRLPVYLSTVFVSAIFFYQQHIIFNRIYSIHPHSIAENLFYATAILNEIFYIYFALYPVMYALVLRIEEGEWPSSLQVWGSEKMRRRERGVEKRGPLGLIGVLRLLPSYTFYGDLGKRERLPDIEDAESGME